MTIIKTALIAVSFAVIAATSASAANRDYLYNEMNSPVEISASSDARAAFASQARDTRSSTSQSSSVSTSRMANERYTW